MSAVDDAIVEIEAELARIAPIHEGLRDYERLNLQPETLAEVTEARTLYDQWVALAQGALAALYALQGAGWPTIPVQDVSASVLADLEANKATIDAALTQFAAIEEAVSLGTVTLGPPEPK